MARSWKRLARRAWQYVWHDTSWHSLLVSTLLFFILLKYIVYPSIAFILGTPLPIVAVVSESMEHRTTYHPSRGWWICTASHLQPASFTLQEYWSYCGSWYEAENITLPTFSRFPFPNGFNRGDVMIITHPRNIRQGDVIVYRTYNGLPVIHRVIRARQEGNTTYYLVKGDHNPSPIRSSLPPFIIDETRLPAERIIGKAWIRIPYLGLPRLWLARLLGQLPS